MKELVYPERQRCRACRRYFGFEVIQGLYCRRECAGLPSLPDPSRQPEAFGPVPDAPVLDLPRCCRTVHRRNRAARPKVRYLRPEDASAVRSCMTSETLPEIYQCPHCSYWHLGTWHPSAVIAETS